MGRRRVRASSHIPCCRGAATPHYTHLGEAAWIPHGRAPPDQLYIVPDLKMGAYRLARQDLMREIRLRFPRGREWRVPLRAGQAWHELRRSVAHIMHIDRTLFDLIHQGEVVDYDSLVQAEVHQVEMRWRHPAIRERSWSRHDRSPVRGAALRPDVDGQHVGGVHEEGALHFRVQMPGGCWRLTLHEHELGCTLQALTSDRVLALLRWRYADVFDADRRYIFVAGRSVMRPTELVYPYMQQNLSSTVDAGATILPPDVPHPYPGERPPSEESSDDEEVPPHVAAEAALAEAVREPGPQHRDDREQEPIDQPEGRLAEVPYRPTVEQVFGAPPADASVAYGLPDLSEIAPNYYRKAANQ